VFEPHGPARLHHAHHLNLYPVLSLAIAVLGAWTALDLFNRARAQIGTNRLRWMAVAALVLGVSIWSMHFIAMLGFHPEMPASYDIGLTMLSLLLAVVGSGFAFVSVGRVSAGYRRLVVGGVLMGLAIVGMHYVGMAAMRTTAAIGYRPTLVALSVVIAIGAAFAALVASRAERSLKWRALAAVILGAAIAAMHHTGMAAVVLTPVAHADMGAGVSPLGLAAAVAAGSVGILFLAMGASLFDQRTNVLAAVDAGGVGFWEARLPLRAPVLSPRARTILSVPPDGRLGPTEIGDRLSPEDRILHRAALEQAITGEADYDQEWFLPETGRWIHLRGRLVRSRSGRPERMSGVITDITDRREAFAALADSERQQRVLINELNHRVKNTLATVQSIARQTARRTPDIKAFIPVFESRLIALSNTQNLLTAHKWDGVDLRILLDQEFAPYAAEQVCLSGPPVDLDPRQALGMGLAFHEMAVNAAKYGALFNTTGVVRVDWSVGDGHLMLDWVESGGPSVTPPTRRGFGSDLIESTVNRSLEGTAVLAYPPEGFSFSLRLPLGPTSETDV
jgi:NO-binding membrane sensor protein with MHYT domain/two-component sensor histidine kinase